MKLKKTAGLVTLACGLVALAATDASAQAPTLTGSVSGTTVSIEWTGVAGALGYTLQAGSSPGSSDIASVNLPASVTRVVVTAPAGTYYLRVRATAGAINGPNSNEAVITVGAVPPTPCTTPPTAPTVTANVQGVTLNVTWTAVAGAQGYRVEFSRTSGGTEYVVMAAATTTTLQQRVSVLGTYFVRVVVGTACGTATSTEASFSVTNLGPRVPNPSPGELLPRPFMLDVVVQLSLQFPAEFSRSRATDCGGSMAFMYRLLQELRRRDTRWGLNYKRGNRPTLSEDILAYNPTDRPDEGESQVYLFDVIGGDCGREAPVWGDVTDVTWANRGQPYCGTTYCAYWTIEPYLNAGYSDGRPQQ